MVIFHSYVSHHQRVVSLSRSPSRLRQLFENVREAPLDLASVERLPEFGPGGPLTVNQTGENNQPGRRKNHGKIVFNSDA